MRTGPEPRPIWPERFHATARDATYGFVAQVGVVLAVHAAFATLLASAPRREGTLGKVRLSPIAVALRAQAKAPKPRPEPAVAS